MKKITARHFFLFIGSVVLFSASAFAANNAQFVSQSVPSSMTAGQTYSVSVTMKNTGTTAWKYAGGFKLGSQNPQDNSIWGMSRVSLASGETIKVGKSKKFTFNVVAPSAAGNYNFQWRMLKEGVQWFGQTSTNVAISVQAPAGSPQLGAITPASGSSAVNQQTSFATSFSHTGGWQKLGYVHLLMNTSVNGSNAFFGMYTQNDNKLWLKDDSNSTWLGGFAPGSANTIENSYVKLHCASTSVSGSGNNMTVTWSVTFKSTFTGAKNSYLYAVDDNSVQVGWAQKGTWTIDAAPLPQVGTITPSSGSSAANQQVSFITTFSHASGWQALTTFHLLVNTNTGGTNAFFGLYTPDNNKLWLQNDASSSWLGGFAPGSANTIENSYVKLHCANSTVSGSGNTMTITWSITFKPTFAGNKNMYLFAADSSVGTGWIQKGTWTITAPADNPPTCTLQTPDTDDITLSGATYNVGASAADDLGVTKVEFYVDGVLKSTDTTSPYSYVLNTTTYSNGTHTVKATAYDAGNKTATSQRSVTFYNSSVIQQPSLVSRSGYRLLFQKRKSDGTLEASVNYNMKGVCWSPASSCMAGDTATRRGQFSTWVNTDSALMQSAYVNTVRTYIDFGTGSAAVNGLATLDALYNKGIMVVMAVDADGRGDFANALKVVKTYKNHPAVLMWLIGNEWNINLYGGAYGSLASAASATQDIAQQIKLIDTNHAVASSLGEITYPTLNDVKTIVNSTCTSVDVWGANIYRGNSFGDLFTVWKTNFTKPIFIAEYGTDSYHATSWWPVQGFVDEAMQSTFNASLIEQIKANLSADSTAKVCVGGTPFEWNDEWWKVKAQDGGTNCGQENGGFFTDWNPTAHPDSFANEEYFGLVKITRAVGNAATLKLAYTTLQSKYNPTAPTQVVLKAVSEGANADPGSYFYGGVWYYKDGTLFFEGHGGGYGNRGITVSVIDSATGAVEVAGLNFDTYMDRPGQSTALANYINGLSNGKIVIIGVADTAIGTTGTLGEDALQVIEQQLGSTQIRNIIFRGSYALISQKGTNPSWKKEGTSNDQAVTLETTVPLS